MASAAMRPGQNGTPRAGEVNAAAGVKEISSRALENAAIRRRSVMARAVRTSDIMFEKGPEGSLEPAESFRRVERDAAESCEPYVRGLQMRLTRAFSDPTIAPDTRLDPAVCALVIVGAAAALWAIIGAAVMAVLA
jgi:hypothetical protein